MSGNTLKVIWICHFTNAEMQNLLPVWRKKKEFAPWIPNLLRGFEYREDIELHVISPLEYLKKTIKLTLRNIHYYFIPYGIPVWHRHWPWILRLDIYTDFYFLRKRIKQVINSINPDLINLMGAENAYYSSSVFDFKDEYPVLITIQGFIGQLKSEYRYKGEFLYRINLEEKILRTFKYFSGEQDSSIYISDYKTDHVFFRMYYPVNETLISSIKDTDKKFDCIYFGNLTRTKGVEDFIKVIAEIKTRIPEIKACIIGGGNAAPFISLSKKLNCEENIVFKGFVNSQKELFEYVKSSKVFLAPPYVERLSSTIREAMFLKVPVVAYSTGGIPYINEMDEHIYLTITGDYKEMAVKALRLLNNDNLRSNLTSKAYRFYIKEFSLKVNTERLISAYFKIMNEYKRL